MTFVEPDLLFSLAAVPLAALGYLILQRRRSRRSALWSRPAMFPNIVWRPSRKIAVLPFSLFLLSLTMFLIGLARPQRVLGDSTGKPATVVVAFDVSGSMAARDVQPTRFDEARKIAVQILNQVPSQDRVSVLTFSDKVRLAVPPSLDHRQAATRLPAKVTPRSGTSIGDAVSAGLAIIINGTNSGIVTRNPPGVIVLFSDGGQTGGGTSPSEAAVIARADGIPIETVAMGTSKGIVTQPTTVDGFRTTVRIPVPVDLATMKMLSSETSGASYVVTSPAQAKALPKMLTPVYATLRPSGSNVDRRHELGSAAAALGFLSLLGGIVISAILFRRPA